MAEEKALTQRVLSAKFLQQLWQIMVALFLFGK
jgi:hypothetical protein